jgi:hypothetical protein
LEKEVTRTEKDKHLRLEVVKEASTRLLKPITRGYKNKKIIQIIKTKRYDLGWLW